MPDIVDENRGTTLNKRQLFLEGTHRPQRDSDGKMMMALQGGLRTLRMGLQPIKSSFIAPATLIFMSFHWV